MNLLGYPNAVTGFAGPQPYDGTVLDKYGRGTQRRIDRHFFVFFMRDHVVPPPHRRPKSDDQANCPYRPVSDEAGKQ